MYDMCSTLYKESTLDTGHGVEGNSRCVGRAKNHLRTYTIRKEYKQIKTTSQTYKYTGPCEDLYAFFAHNRSLPTPSTNLNDYFPIPRTP